MHDVEETRARFREKGAAFRREVVDKMSQLATAAFALVAALAWNNAIQSLFKNFYPAPDSAEALWPLVAYAMLITIVAVVTTFLVGRMAARLKTAEKKDDADAQ